MVVSLTPPAGSRRQQQSRSLRQTSPARLPYALRINDLLRFSFHPRINYSLRFAATLLAALLLSGCVFAHAAEAAGGQDHSQRPEVNAISGLWLTESGEAHIELFACHESPSQSRQTVCGRIAWMAQPLTSGGEPKRDHRNPDPARRSELLLGSTMIEQMQPSGPQRWSEGTIYHAQSGKSYRGKIRLHGNDSLTISGCLLFVCLGETWTRLAATSQQTGIKGL